MKSLIDHYTARGWTEIHGGPPAGAFWRGRNPKTGRMEKLPPVWTFSIVCGGSERHVRVEAASCAMEKGDRYVWRDAHGEWIAEVLATALILPPDEIVETGSGGDLESGSGGGDEI